MNLDYPVSNLIQVDDEAALCDALASRDQVRLIGSGSSQSLLAAPDTDVDVISTAGMNQILRLEADDLTCSVEPGVLRADLDAALAEHGLWLPCGGSGTIGGIFAADLHGPLAPAQHEPRSLLLGISAVLADGTPFKSGARVVKSVAGFDLQKLFVGSRGQLFAASALHLKLRPRPPLTLGFEHADLSLSSAMERMLQMRQSHVAPLQLSMTRSGASFTLTGVIGGDPSYLEAWARRLELTLLNTTSTPAPKALEPSGGEELVQGLVQLKRLPELLERLPEDAPFALHGLRFWTCLSAARADQLLTTLPALGGGGTILAGPADRRGQTSPTDPVIQRLEGELAQTLDPGRTLR